MEFVGILSFATRTKTFTITERPSILWALHKLPRQIQDRLTGEERIGGPNLVGIHGPLTPKPSHNPLFANQEKRRPGIEALGLPFVIVHSVCPNGLPIGIVTEQRVRQLQRGRERLLRVGVINPDAQYLDAQVPELLMVVPPGR
jgi:hypothetical protein